MNTKGRQTRLQTAAIVIGYGMSRLDSTYLAARGLRSWKSAFEKAGNVLGVPPSTMKHLRDEFDPFHKNVRKGWRNRPLRPNRQRVLSDFLDVSDDALLGCINCILAGDTAATAEIVDSIREISRPAYNVAERLLTGRRAEEFFLARCHEIVGIKRSDLVDERFSAIRFDFSVAARPDRVIEVKGMKHMSGAILFADREWAEAKLRRENYWLVVVGNLSAIPKGRFGIIHNATCRLPAGITAHSPSLGLRRYR